MSYIDTINHSYVGTFAGLPVYHPLENLDEEGKDEFSATPKNLVIGGGSGEHPGLVIKNLDACVWNFLEFVAEANKKDPDEIEFYTKWIEKHEFFEEYNIYHNLNFAHWGIDMTVKFANELNNQYENKVQYLENKKELRKKTTEERISIMVGEFIFFSAQNLISDELRDYIESNKEGLNKDEIQIFSLFFAVQVPPKGYPVIGGRSLVKDAKDEIQVKWGLRFEEEHLIDPILNDPNRNKKSSKLKM